MLAVRGEDGWIGGVGVVAGRRGEGVGERLMRAVHEQARARGVRRLWLEVLTQNEPAVQLYEKLGFEHVRELEVWSLDMKLGSPEHRVPTIPVAHAIGRSTERPPWQRADASVTNLADAQAVGDDRGSVVFRMTAGVAALQQVAAADEQAIHELLGSLPEETVGLRYLNGPEGDPVNVVLESLGGTQVARQHELVLHL